MDDFEDDELYDDYDGQVYEEEESESLKDKYDRAKEYKEKYDKLKEKYGNKSPNNTAGNVGKNAGKEVGKDAAKQGGKEVAKESGKKAGEQIAKEAGKKATTEAGKQVAKEGAKVAAKEGAKVAAEGAAASTGVGIIVAAGIEVADRLNKLKKKIDKKVDSKVEEATGIQGFSKKKKFIPILVIIAIFMLLFIFPAMAMYSISETATSELTTLVRAREENNEKKLIMFTKSELKELLNRDIVIDEEIAKKLAEEGYTLEYENDKYKSIGYKNILKGYGSDLTNVFMPTDISNASSGMEDVLDDESYDSLNDKDKDVAISTKNVKKYLMAEIDNFNNGVTWQTTNLKVEYLNKNAKEKYDNYNSYKNSTVKVTASGNGTLVDKEITNKNYTVKDDNGKDTMLKMPKLSSYGVDVSEGENKVARTYVDMLEPYMQKWIIPYTIYIDTQDEAFVDNLLSQVYHPAYVSLFQLQKLTKTTAYEYYMKCHTYQRIEYVTYTDTGTIVTDGGIVSGSRKENLNTRDYPVGEKTISSTEIGKRRYKVIIQVTEVSEPYAIATESDGDPMVKTISVSRNIGEGTTQPELTHVASFYEIIDREFKINPIDENDQPNEIEPGELDVNISNGIGSQTIKEYWNESVEAIRSEVKDYEVSYYTEEQMQDLGRKISRIEWYQDSNSMVSGGIDGASGGGINQTQQKYIDKYREDALNDMNESGVLASITLAQGILEGGSGTSSLASKYNNHFGIKAGSSWKGNTVMLKTGEYDKSGNYYTISSSFRAYDNAADSFADHSKFIWNTKGHSTKSGGYRYRDCTEYAKSMTYTAPDGSLTYDYRGAIQAIVDGGYCTDPTYVSKICNIIETYKLYEIDRESTWDGTAPAYATENTSGTTGSSSSSISSGGGETLYSYDDMYFAYYQIEQWYEKSGTSLSAQQFEIVNLPEGGFGWPLNTSGDTAKIYRMYGSVKGYTGNHDGIDIYNGSNKWYDSDEALTKGNAVYATHDGKVSKVQPVTDESTYAYIEIKTDDGKFKTHYGCLSEISVNEGDIVTKGQTIGKVGKTGAHAGDTELYLHYKMYYKNSVVDPLQYYVIQDSSGNAVNNYNDLDKSTVEYNTYLYKSSRLYLTGMSFSEGGDISQGYSGIYHSSSGRTYIEYVQDKGSWANTKINSWGLTVGAAGCWIASSATIVSGYGYTDVTPALGASWMNAKGSSSWALLANYTSTSLQTVGSLSSAKQAIVNHLMGGNAVMFYSQRPPAFKSWKQHCMAMLDVRQNGSKVEVYVSTVNTALESGWYDVDQAIKGLVYYWLVNPKD